MAKKIISDRTLQMVADLTAENTALKAKIARVEARWHERYDWTPEGMEAKMGGEYVSWSTIYLALADESAP